jgi:hypothetical protein
MPATPNIVADLIDLLTNRLALDDLKAVPQETLDRLAIQLEYWDSMAISLSSDIERNQ